MDALKVIARLRCDFPTKFGLPRQSGLNDALKGKIVFEPAYRNLAPTELSELFRQLDRADEERNERA